MPSKTIDINTDAIKKWFTDVKQWLQNFFKTMDDRELYATIGVGLGFVLLIVGVILV